MSQLLNNKSNVIVIRRSKRAVKKRDSYSPDHITCSKPDSNKNGKINKITKNKAKIKSCSVCKGPYCRKKYQSKSNVNPRSLCSICAIKASANKKTSTTELLPLQDLKEKYLEDAKNFGKSLKDVFQDQEAERLYCPVFKKRPCACLQKHILIDVNESQQKATFLLQMLKEAKRLSRLKCYSKEKLSLATETGEDGKKTPGIGLGNGQKRSKDFEVFVLEKRTYLRQELKLCERACQKVLFYSNNFLHKKLKTEPQRSQRVERKKGKAALGLLIPIFKLSSQSCCPANCGLIAATHGTLLEQWRVRAASSQADSWKVIAEMLTPAAGGRLNCFKFVEKVTGCSLTTISKVNEQMALTGGDREPPEHGLKKWWQDQALKFNKDFSQKPDEPVDLYEIPQTNAETLPNVLTRNSLHVDNNYRMNVNCTQSNYNNVDSVKTLALKLPVAKKRLIESAAEDYSANVTTTKVGTCSDVPEDITDPLWSSDNPNSLIRFP